MRMRSWKYRLYPTGQQQKELERYLLECKNLWNALLEQTKKRYKKAKKFPNRKDLYRMTKGTVLFSQVAQNVADRLAKSLYGISARKKAGKKAGFPRFKSIERMKSFTYPQYGFKFDETLELSDIGSISIKKHRDFQGVIKTLTIKKSPSGKWFAIFTTELEETPIEMKKGPKIGVDLGIETFAFLSDSSKIENPRNLKFAEHRLRLAQRRMSKKKKSSFNRAKVRHAVAVAYEKLVNKRRDFLHKATRFLVNKYALIAMEDLNNEALAGGFLAKEVLDCSWAEFSSMLRYKAEEAGCEVVLVDPVNTTSTCSNCGLVQKKSLAERWHSCSCGASMHRDLNAAINILNRATLGTRESKVCGEETSTCYEHDWQVSSVKREAQRFSAG